MKKITYRVKGSVPLLHHNIRLANPMDKYTKAHKKISSKRKKTDEDHIEMARLEFYGGLYYTEKQGFYIPASNWRAAAVEGARKFRLGKTFISSVTPLDYTTLAVDGPNTPEERWEEGYYDMSAVRVNKARIMRTRPRFDKWSTKVTFLVDLTEVDLATMDQVMGVLGSQIGIGDYRPIFGKFEVSR